MSLTTQRSRRRQSPDETRRQILDAAIGLLRERSFRELSVDALMARTGHSRTLFYRHFDDIPALILALIEDVGSELIELGQQWSESDRVGPDEARTRLAGFVGFHTRNRALVRAVVEAAHHDDAVEQAYDGMVEGFVQLTARTIQARIDGGELGTLDAPEIARALILMINGYLADPRRTDDPERVLDTLWTIWTRTLFPEGHAPRGSY
jgi:TetR/AcrR family transcriptional regulator, ethionamide resistance regulator